MSAVLNFAGRLANLADGNNTVENASTTVAELANQAVESFTQQKTARGTLFNLIYEDWGRIEALGMSIRSGRPEWVWNGEATDGQLLKALNTAAEQSFCRSLMPTVYVAGDIRDFNSPSPWDYQTFGSKNWEGFLFPYNPFAGYSADAYQSSLQVDGMKYEIRSLAKRSPSGRTKSYSQPSQNILNRVLKSMEGGGLGVSKYDFFRHWKWPAIGCDKSSASGGNGCDFPKAR